MASLKMVNVLVEQGDNRNELPASVPAYEVPVLRAIYEDARGGTVVEVDTAWLKVPDVEPGQLYERMLAKYRGNKEANKALASVYPTREYFAERLDRFVDTTPAEEAEPATDAAGDVDALAAERQAIEDERAALAREREELEAARAELAKAKEAQAAAKPAEPAKTEPAKTEGDKTPAGQGNSTTKPA